MAEINIGPRPRGRPTNDDKDSIDMIIREHFLQGNSPSFVIAETGLDKNTVYKKYRGLRESVAETEKVDFLKRYEGNKIQQSMALDNLNAREFKILEMIEEKIQSVENGEAIPPYLLQTFLSLSNSLLAISKERARYNFDPTLIENMKEKIREELEEN